MLRTMTAARVRTVNGTVVILTAEEAIPTSTTTAENGAALPDISSRPTVALPGGRGQTAPPAPPTRMPLPLPAMPPPTTVPAAPDSPAPPPVTNERIVNLDRGGGRRWADGNFDFGEEPQDEGTTQVWSCHHEFEPYKLPPEDGFDHGDLTRMECNRCFERVEVRKEAPNRGGGGPKKRRKLLGAGSGRLFVSDAKDDSQEDTVDVAPFDNEASECKRCRMVCCVACKGRYLKEQPVED